MMNSISDFFEKARTIASAAGKKTGEMVEISKLKLQAVQINSDIQKAYERLGSIKYEQEKTGTDNTDLMDVCISEIDALLVSLNEINDKISNSKSMVRCPNCGASNPEESIFCSRCGTNLTEQCYGKAMDVDPDAQEEEEKPVE